MCSLFDEIASGSLASLQKLELQFNQIGDAGMTGRWRILTVLIATVREVRRHPRLAAPALEHTRLGNARREHPPYGLALAFFRMMHLLRASHCGQCAECTRNHLTTPDIT